LPENPLELKETIVVARTCVGSAGGVDWPDLFTFVSGACGATGFSTGIARFKHGARLPYHSHAFSEAITVLDGWARILVEGRAYRLGARDCIHIPMGIAHQVENPAAGQELVVHWSFATDAPTRDLIDREFSPENRGSGSPSPADPETIVRYDDHAVYELSKDAFFLDLFARRYGAVGICGGHGRFLPGASLPCHVHDFDESITIVKGKAVCLVEGRRYELSGCDTAFIPQGLPHRFLNLSGQEMEMVWVYAGSEPDRRMVESKYCSGEMVWPGPKLA
jgi:putative monooxygenase